MENHNPFEKWNGFDRDNPNAPWNNPMKKDDPFACWNNPFGKGKHRDEVDNFGNVPSIGRKEISLFSCITETLALYLSYQ